MSTNYYLVNKKLYNGYVRCAYNIYDAWTTCPKLHLFKISADITRIRFQSNIFYTDLQEMFDFIDRHKDMIVIDENFEKLPRKSIKTFIMKELGDRTPTFIDGEWS